MVPCGLAGLWTVTEVELIGLRPWSRLRWRSLLRSLLRLWLWLRAVAAPASLLAIAGGSRPIYRSAEGQRSPAARIRAITVDPAVSSGVAAAAGARSLGLHVAPRPRSTVQAEPGVGAQVLDVRARSAGRRRPAPPTSRPMLPAGPGTRNRKATGSARPRIRPWRSTRSISSGSTLPPESTATTGGSKACGSSINAATARGPGPVRRPASRVPGTAAAPGTAASSDDGAHLGAQLLDQREGDIAGARHGDAVGHGQHPVQAHRVPGSQRPRVGRRAGCLHADHPHVATVSDRGGDARQQAAAPGGHHDRADVGHLLEDLQADGVPCPATTSRWSNGWINVAPVR